MSLPPFRGGGLGSAVGSGSYPGVGQGLPARFPAAGRQGSGAAAVAPGVQSPPFGRGQFNLGVAPTAGGPPEGNLDPSDFPALGQQLQQQQQQAATSSSASASLPPPPPQQPTPTLSSSYASQAGNSTHPPPPPLTNNTAAAAAAPAPGQHLSSTSAPTRSFSSPSPSSDFPALSPFSLTEQQMNGQQQMNGISLLPGGVARSTAPSASNPAPPPSNGQEQASAMAALQQQQQHRANLLGSMNGQAGQQQRMPSSGQGQDAAKAFANKPSSSSSGGNASQQQQQQPWASTPPSQHAQPPLNNGANLGGGAASSPLPPPATSDSLRSPSSSAPPPGVPRAVGAPSNSSSLPSSLSGGGGGLPPTSLAPQTPADQVLFSPADRYGLLGLLQIIKTTDPDLSMLALGSDLTSLGLDLGATDNLYSTFITPWSDSKAASALNIEPEFHLPSCYNVQPPPAQSKIGNFSDETLFFIFYSQPRDAMQEMAAHELYKHNWRYHKELRLWLTKEAGTEPTQKTSSYERGSYIIFDPTVWERVRKEFVLEFSALESRRG